MFCVGDDVNIEKANDSLISNDRSWKKNKFRLTYTAESPSLTEGKRSPGVGGFGGESQVERVLRAGAVTVNMRRGAKRPQSIWMSYGNFID